MSNVAPLNMFPTAGESVVIAARDVGKQPQAAEPDTAPAVPADPWANPTASLQRPGAAPSADDSKSHKRLTRAEQVVEFLRANGPSASAPICAALGLSAVAGVAPFIAAALKSGAIRRDKRLYFLPEHDHPSDTPERAATVHEQPEAPAAGMAPSSHETEVETRTPDFTISAGDALLVGWPDGAVTVQRGGVFVNLSPQQARMLRVFVELRN